MSRKMKMKMKTSAVVWLSLLLLCQCRGEALKKAKPEDVGMSGKHLRLLDGVIKEAISRKDFPGAILLVGRKGMIVYHKAYGDSQWVPERRPMKEDMIFDCASITKPVATATSIMILAEKGKVSLEDKVRDYIPEFALFIDEGGIASEDARIWHLLTHTSGLPPYTDVSEVEKKYGNPCTTEHLVAHIAGLKKLCPPGKEFHYSCLGFITLAHIVKKVNGQTIAEFASENIFKPLKMNHTFFSPKEKYISLCVPTQVIEGKPLRGIVHDPLARLQGGISGNAGLYSTADDLAVFARMMLGKGEYKGIRILSPLSVERMTSVFPKVAFSGRGLGWDLDSSYATNGGDLFGPNSYGHTGYTGTSIWIDPDTETFVIFLTNSVHPNDKGTAVSMRRRVANIVAASIIDQKK